MDIGFVYKDKYEIKSVIGQGGMGTVYLAENLENGSTVAIKEQNKNHKNFRQLQNEIAIQQSLNHRLIPKVIAVNETPDKVWIVMEYIRGRTLSDVLSKGDVIEEKRAIKWALQIVSALKYMHSLEHPVVYRDLKPSNLMIDEKDDLHLIDFGIAQEYDDVEKFKRGAHGLTKGYAAPEQYDLKFFADARTDIYSFGVTMHYMLTGKNPVKPPYHFVKVRKLNSSLSLGIENILFRCLQPNPDKRFSKVEELENALQSVDALSAQIRKRNRLKIGVVSGLSIAFVALCVTLFINVSQHGMDRIEQYRAYLEEAGMDMVSEDYEAAYEALDQAIVLEPESPDAYIYLIPYYYGTKGADHALLYAGGELLEKFPDLLRNDLFLEQVGLVYYKEHRYGEALYYFDILSRNHPDNPEYGAIYEKISSLTE